MSLHGAEGCTGGVTSKPTTNHYSLILPAGINRKGDFKMKHNNVFGTKTIGVLAAMAAALIIMGGCTTFQSIAVTPPAKTVFGQGEEFTYEGLQVAGTTKKGETKDLSGDRRIKVSGYDPARTGEQTITVDYRGVTTTYTVTVAGVESIAIDQSPTTARQGMDIDRSSLRVTASYGEKLASRPVQGYEVNISGYDKDRPGAQTITAEYYGKTATFTVTVAPLTGIKITKPPAKVSYLSGEPLDLTGIEATASWQGAGDAPVTPEYVSGFDTTAQGTQTVIVEALGKQASFTVTVKEPAAPEKWTPVQAGFAKNITGIAYGNGIFVAAGYNDDPGQSLIAYSADGISWTKASSPLEFKVTKVFFGGGKFIVGGYNTERGAYLSESSDGNYWQSQGFHGEEMLKEGLGDCIGITYGKNDAGKNIWVAAFSSSRMRVNVGGSSGLSWTIARVYGIANDDTTEPTWSSSVCGVLFNGRQFIAFDSTGRYVYSANGSRWEPGEGTIVFGGRPISEVVFGDGKFIGVGPNNALGWSTDGITWTDADHKGEELRGGDLNGVAYGFGMFVAVNSRGNIIYSRDGFTWTKVTSSTFGSTNIRDVAYGNGKFIAIGDNGRIAYSNKID
jgi:hypothetical protein